MRYLHILWAIIKANLKIDLEYRANFFLRLLGDIFWYLSQIVVFEVLFIYITNLGSWGIEQIRVFLGFIFITDAIYMIFFHENIERFSERVRRGELDLLLTRPISSQFFVSLARISTGLSSNLIISLAYMWWALLNYPGNLPILSLVAIFILIPSGVMAIYSVRFCISTLALIIVRAENLHYLWYQVYRLGLRPDQIYHPWLRYVLVTILPVGLIANVPSRLLFHPEEKFWMFFSPFVAAILLFLSHLFWQKALKFYSSASS